MSNKAEGRGTVADGGLGDGPPPGRLADAAARGRAVSNAIRRRDFSGKPVHLLMVLLAGAASAKVAVAGVDDAGRADSTKPATELAGGQKVSPATSMLRVSVTSQAYNFSLPWQKRPPTTRQGLGALITGNQVLVTAELIQDANYIELEQALSGRKITAQAQTIDYEANLALLKPVEDAGDFFRGMVALELGKSPPKKGDKFDVWQFEENGSPVITEITFEKAELGNYFLENSYFLQFEANGAVSYRAGSFTLPVLHQGKLAGMLLTYSSKDQVAEILPYPIINRFVEDAADGPYDGFPNFGVRFAPTLDEQLRSYLKLTNHAGGILVTGLMSGTSAAVSGLKEGDVLLQINGKDIDARGNYYDETWGMMALGHLVKGNARVGDELKTKIIRNGEAMDLAVKMTRKTPSQYLIDPYMFDRGPRFLIAGGLVFQELTQTFLEAFGKEWRDRASFKLVYAVAHPESYEKEGRRKLVFLAGVLPSESSLGYEGIGGSVIKRVNGIDIKDIKDLDAALKTPIEGIHKVEIDDSPYTLYLDASLAEQDNTSLLPQRYRIRDLKRLE
ncbi:MAG: PDZ domain-containing protein [Verrucomicrobiales bacterium]